MSTLRVAAQSHVRGNPFAGPGVGFVARAEPYDLWAELQNAFSNFKKKLLMSSSKSYLYGRPVTEWSTPPPLSSKAQTTLLHKEAPGIPPSLLHKAFKLIAIPSSKAMISVVPVLKIIVCRKAPFPLVLERDQLEYMAPEILFTLSIPSPYPTCALTNSDFWCHVFQVVRGEKHICSSWVHKMMCVVVYDTPSAVCCYTALNQANHMLREYLYTVLK